MIFKFLEMNKSEVKSFALNKEDVIIIVTSLMSLFMESFSPSR